MAGVRVRGSVAVNYRGGYIDLDVTRADALAELALDQPATHLAERSCSPSAERVPTASRLRAETKSLSW